MSEINDILRSVGLDESRIQGAVVISQTIDNTPQIEEAQVIETIPAEEIPTEESTDTLSDSDFNDILSANGITTESTETITTPTEESVEDTSIPELEVVQEFPVPTEETPVEDKNTFPLNPPSPLIKETTSRFSGASWYEEIQKKSIVVGGAGGIGSHLLFNLGRVSPKSVYVYDDDIVETSNMSGQVYCTDDIGRTKVSAIQRLLFKYCPSVLINVVNKKFDIYSAPGDIMMCGFDSIEARKMFFKVWKTHVRALAPEKRKNCLFMDGRLSLTVMQILCITGDDEYNIDRYEKEFLFDKSQAEETVCSMKQTTYLASIIGGMMVNLFTNWVANSLDPIIPYTLPFFTEYDATYMIFKTEN